MQSKILYFGGQKSGKSILAEKKTLELANKDKPYYIATYDNSFDDKEMKQRIQNHKNQREDEFITIEESCDLVKIIKPNQTYIIDCLSMWILNNLDNEKFLFEQIKAISQIKANIVFVLNDVNSGVIPIDKISRKYIDICGLVGQKIAQICDIVFEVKLGLEIKLK